MTQHITLPRAAIAPHAQDATLIDEGTKPAPVAQPVCPECSAELLYECVACGHTNYPKQRDLRPASEPHGWLIQGCSRLWKEEFAEMDTKAEARRVGGTCYAYPVYTSPVALQPLNGKQIKSMWAQHEGYAGGILDFARAIEAAHGIGAEKGKNE